MISSDTKLVHIHIPKTAGTTLNAILENNYGRRFLELSFSYTRSTLREVEQAAVASHFADYDCLSSHKFVAPFPGPDRSEFLPIAFLRHPVKRVISEYRFTKSRVIRNLIQKKALISRISNHGSDPQLRHHAVMAEESSRSREICRHSTSVALGHMRSR